MATSPNVTDARGLSFACLPGCGYCCAVSPLVEPREAGALGPLAVRGDDGALHIPIRGLACSALGADRRCTVYEARPTVCRQFPYQVHAGRRVQVTISLACPGVQEGEGADEGAPRAAEAALAMPGADARVARARETFSEFDRRMKEWGIHATSDKLRSAFAGPHLDALARPESLSPFFAGIAQGDLTLEARDAVPALFQSETDADLGALLQEAARDAFDGNAHALWVEPTTDFAWSVPKLAGEQIELRGKRYHVDDLPTAWREDASAALAVYLRRLTQRDHTEGAAAWLVDASGYQATLPAAYARVLGEAALQVVLRAGLAGAEAGADEITPALAWRGVRAYETSYHSLPTLGAVL